MNDAVETTGTEPVVEGSAATEQVAETVAVGKAKVKPAKTGNLIQDIAVEVEGLTKIKALNLADDLAENIETNYFKLGGILKLISDNSWFEGYADFNTFVFEKYGFQGRKAAYLMAIYTDLVTKQIPWEKVGHLGWTKLKDLAPILTLDNVDEWVAKAEKLTVLELLAALKATMSPTGETSTTTTDAVVKMTFKLSMDQSEIVQAALSKAKGELGSEFDTVALENICAGYLGGTVSSANVDVQSVIKGAGWKEALTAISEIWPEIDMKVNVPESMQ